MSENMKPQINLPSLLEAQKDVSSRWIHWLQILERTLIISYLVYAVCIYIFSEVCPLVYLTSRIAIVVFLALIIDPTLTELKKEKELSRRLMILLDRLGPFMGLIAVYGIFVIIAPPSFATIRNMEMIARQTTIVGVAALGMTIVIISGGIDLSVGSIVALSTVVIAWLLQNAGVNPLIAAVGGVAAAAFFGLISGMLITRLRVVPFIVTLGMMLVVRGAAKGIGREQKIDVEPERLKWLEELLATVPKERSWMLLPPGVWILIILAIATAALLRYTRLGRHTFAIGSNEETARLCGVAVERVKVLVFTLCGAFAGLAGLMQFSRLTVGDPTVAVGLELNVIAAVVIGGGSLSGGEGSILGTLVGALLMTTIASGCTQMGLPNWVQEIITGAIIVVAVAVDRLRHRRSL